MKNLCALFLLSLGCMPLAQAATFCVGNAPALQLALNIAAENDEDDAIHLQATTFVPPITQGFYYLSTDTHALTLAGGYIGFFDNPCGLYFQGSGLSVIDGNGSKRLFGFSPAAGLGDLHLARIAFRHGINQANDSPVVIGAGGYAGDVTLDRVEISSNVSAVQAIFASTSGSITIRNSLFVDNVNIAGYNNIGIAEFNSYGGSGTSGMVFNGNTVSGNSSQVNGWSGYIDLTVQEGGPMHVANNIFWNNGKFDLLIDAEDGTVADVSYSDIGAVHFYGSNTQHHVLSMDPQFADGYHLAPSSPLRDAGDNAAVGGIGSYDANGQARLVFGAVDFGALEVQDRIFRNGFD